MLLSTSFRKHLRWRSRESIPSSTQHSLSDSGTSAEKDFQLDIGHPIPIMEISAPQWDSPRCFKDVLSGPRFRCTGTDEISESRTRLSNEEAMRGPYFIGSVRDVPLIESDESISRKDRKDNGTPESLPRYIAKDSVLLSAENAQGPPTPEITITPADRTGTKPLSDIPTVGTTNTGSRKDDQHVYLLSTPYTLTQPSFRHGPIVLSKADGGRGVELTDDTIDWKAFQIAIQGGIGDFSQNMSNEQDEKEVEEIISWFDTFCFETHGALVTEDVPKLEFKARPSIRPSSYSTVSSTPSTIDIENNLPIPLDAEFPSGFWNALEPNEALEKIKFFKSTGLKRWFCEGGPKRPSFHNSDESLPASPMLPLMVDEETAPLEKVPMGYNLGHDLGDFLRWQEENIVYI